MEESSAPYKHYLNFSSQERKTSIYIFGHGKHLPYDMGLPHMPQTLQDPKEYDLVFSSLVGPEILKKYDVVPVNKPVLIVNQRVIDILTEMCPHDFQIFPATIIPETKKQAPFENHEYFVLNLTKTVDVIDEENSVFERWPDNDLKNIKSVTYLENKMNGLQLARQYNYHLDIIASPDLVKRFKKEKIKGVKFLKDCEYFTF